MRNRSAKVKLQQISKKENCLQVLWNSFWNQPTMNCPKCGASRTEYYDPFFFAPLRTLHGKRRIKCSSCLFVWRPSRTDKTIWDIINPFSR